MVIVLGGGRKPQKQNIFSRGLDILSSTLLEPTTFIRDPIRAGEIVRQRRADVRAGKKGALASNIAETLTATAIGAGAILLPFTGAGRALLTRFIPKILPTTIPKALATATVGGILLTSKSARRGALRIIDDPTKVGREAGKVIDKVISGEDPGTLGNVLKTAGIIGGGALVIGGVVAGTKKFLGREKSATPGGQPTDTLPSAAFPLSIIPPQEIFTETSLPIVTASKEDMIPSPSVVVTNNIKINNRSSANRRFINNVNVV